MMDVEKHVAYWRTGADEDWAVGEELLEGRPRHALFMFHLALEKALKAHVCRASKQVPPKTHSLVRLAELSALDVPKTYLTLLVQMNRFQLEGRYPEFLGPAPSVEDARSYHERGKEVFQWLMKQL
jgi:HEPN domain-containing protein